MSRAWVALLLLLFQPLLFAGPTAGPVSESVPAPAGSSPALVEVEPLPLRSGQGYLVLDLRLEQRVTEILFNRGGAKVTLGPYEKGRHLLLLPVSKGDFRLDKVASPSYDLPFRQSYSGYDRLKFSVLRDRINYFGQIIVGDIRSSYGFEIHVRNRLAYSYGELTEKYGALLTQYPIHYGGKLTDHFYDEFLKPEQAKADE